MNDGDKLSSSGKTLNDPTKKTRTRSGCLVCRRRRRKCDELHPECMNCRQRGESCEWGMKIIFRSDNATRINPEHPSMLEGSRKRARHYKIVDVTSQIERDYRPTPSTSPPDPSLGHTGGTTVTSNASAPNADKDAPSPQERDHFESQLPGESREAQTTYRARWSSESPSFDTPNSVTVSYPDDNSFRADDDNYLQLERSPRSGLGRYDDRNVHPLEYTEGQSRFPVTMTAQTIVSTHDSSNSQINTEDAAADLLALRYLPLQQTSSRVETNPRDMMPPPINATILTHVSQPHDSEQRDFNGQSDGIFLPGSAFREFHSTLRDHLIYTARSNAPTRHGTPEPTQLDVRFSDRLALRADGFVNRVELEPRAGRVSEALEITPQREYILWKTWIGELAPWLDKFDNNRHFEHRITMIAKTTPHLRNSILALSARQIEMKANSKSSSESLALYQEAIHLLLPDLQTKGTAVIASCVILCVLEMMSCSPNEWRRHLEGCANLLEAVGINGFVGGVEEALFWCFARMDLCGALISQDLTLIPVHRWASNIDFATDIRFFKNLSNGFDTYANYAVFLCANCVAYLKMCNGQTHGVDSSRWVELLDLLDDWYTQRPEEMKPILTIPAAQGESQSPFPTVFYGNGPAVSGNQLYHTATLLMLQSKPSGVEGLRKQKSIFWHARQICAISESNSHHGAWTNSIQPIWIAGKVMSHASEHRAILNVLERIERETGWVTSWRREDLKAWWGDGDGDGDADE